MAWEVRDRFRDDVEVFRRVQRHGGPSFRAKFMRPHASAIHDDVGLDVTEGPSNADGLAVFDHDPVDLGVFDDPRAAAPRAFRQRLCGVNRVGLAVFGQMHRAQEIARVEERPERESAFRADNIDLQPKRTRHGGAALQLLHAAVACGDGERTDLPKARRLACHRFKRCVEVGRILREPRQIAGGAKLANQSRGVPRRSAGELLSLEKQDVRAAA